MLGRCWVMLSLLVSSGVAQAHGEEAHAAGATWLGGWDSTWIIACNLTVLSVLYVVGHRRSHQKRHVSQGVAFFAGITVLAVALLPPVATLSEQLGWVHMVQHSLLMMVAAPALVLAAPETYLTLALPSGARRRLGRRRRRWARWRLPWYRLTQPLLTWALFAVTLWIWHVPMFYEAALDHPLVHDAQHLAFFGAAALFWRALLDPVLARRVDGGVGVIYLFLASLHATVLGVLMALSPVVWYRFYEKTTHAYGLDPLADQQLAGFIMWMPACLIYLAVAVVLFIRWLEAAGRGARLAAAKPRGT